MARIAIKHPVACEIDSTPKTSSPLKSPRKISIMDRVMPYRKTYVQNNCPSNFFFFRKEKRKIKIIKFVNAEYNWVG